MSSTQVRQLQCEDYAQWLPLWDGYNHFYGLVGDTALPEAVTQTTWERFFDPAEPLHALVAVQDGRLVGLTHYLFHRSTSRIALDCYLEDLFTTPAVRGQGVGRALIQAVTQAARAAGSHHLYWLTQNSNATARRLYDQVAQHDGFIVYSVDALQPLSAGGKEVLPLQETGHELLSADSRQGITDLRADWD